MRCQLVALRRCLFEPALCICIALRHALALAVRQSEIALRLRMPLLGGRAVPSCRLLVIDGSTLTALVRAREVVLGLRVASFGGDAQPRGGWPDADHLIAAAEPILHIHIARRGGRFVAPQRRHPSVVQAGSPRSRLVNDRKAIRFRADGLGGARALLLLLCEPAFPSFGAGLFHTTERLVGPAVQLGQQTVHLLCGRARVCELEDGHGIDQCLLVHRVSHPARAR
mmetsp:Transcript_42463/g.140720  ORF Transcript_42463/g.140720 Transcript_42463/m.140720 type:complete len:226 (-) Transcript_42463:18-695(-)